MLQFKKKSNQKFKKAITTDIIFANFLISNMCIVIICLPACSVINFEININFLIKSFP